MWLATTIGFGVLGISFIAWFLSIVFRSQSPKSSVAFVTVLIPGVGLTIICLFQIVLMLMDKGNGLGDSLFASVTILASLFISFVGSAIISKDKEEAISNVAVLAMLGIVFIGGGGMFLYSWIGDYLWMPLFLGNFLCLLPTIFLLLAIRRRKCRVEETVYYDGYLRCLNCQRMESNILRISSVCNCGCSCWDKIMARKVYRRSWNPLSWFRFEWEIADSPWVEPTQQVSIGE